MGKLLGDIQEVRMIYQRGRNDLRWLRYNFLGKSKFGLASFMPYAVAIFRNGGRYAPDLKWPSFDSLESEEKQALRLVYPLFKGEETMVTICEENYPDLLLTTTIRSIFNEILRVQSESGGSSFTKQSKIYDKSIFEDADNFKSLPKRISEFYGSQIPAAKIMLNLMPRKELETATENFVIEIFNKDLSFESDLFQKFILNPDPKLAYELGRADIKTPFCGYVGKPRSSLFLVLPYAIAVYRNGGQMSFLLDWPSYDELSGIEKVAVDFVYEILMATDKKIDNLIDLGVPLTIWESAFCLQKYRMHIFGKDSLGDKTPFEALFSAGAQGLKIQAVYGIEKLHICEPGLDGHHGAIDLVAQIIKRGKAYPLTETLAQEQRKATQDMAKPVHIERLQRNGAKTWEIEKSWFGGQPRLGVTPWPRSKGTGLPMQFVAQLDIADIRDKAFAGHLPGHGSLAIFLEYDGIFECKIVQVEQGRKDAPTRPPADKPSAYQCMTDKISFFDDDVKKERCTYPEWPVVLVPDIDHADENKRYREKAERMSAEAQQKIGGPRLIHHHHWEESYPFETVYWHSAIYLVQRLLGLGCERRQASFLENKNEATEDELEDRRLVLKKFNIFVRSLEDRVKNQDPWSVMTSNEEEWFQTVCDTGLTEFRPFLRDYLPHRYEDILKLSLDNPMHEIFWHSARVIYFELSRPGIQEHFKAKLNRHMSESNKNASLTYVSFEDFEILRNRLRIFIEKADCPVWDKMNKIEVAAFKEIVREFQDRFAPFLGSRFSIMNLDASKPMTPTLNALAWDEKAPLKTLPEPVQQAVCMRFRQSLMRNHQMFGLGDAIQSLDHIADISRIMLLQLQYDEAMGWLFGDAGILQIWISTEDFQSLRWDRVETTFDQH